MHPHGQKVVAIVPTYNEPEDLARVVGSLAGQVDRILVINAGDPLPSYLAGQVEEHRVSSDHYWTHCIAKGFELVATGPEDYVYLTNADTYATPGTVQALLNWCSTHPRSVACAAAYIEHQGKVELLYSYQDPMGFLLYGRLIRPWTGLEDAPSEPFEIVLTGGQGVLFPVSVVKDFQVDVERFPHYASDHDLWLQMRSAGWRLTLVPSAGVVNTRTLSANRASGFAKLKKLVWRMTSDMTPESWRIMWRLRRKHLPLPVAVVSTVVSFGLRWTVGLPKILRRT
jgi:GT2 family glycosyltransferase